MITRDCGSGLNPNVLPPNSHTEVGANLRRLAGAIDAEKCTRERVLRFVQPVEEVKKKKKPPLFSLHSCHCDLKSKSISSQRHYNPACYSILSNEKETIAISSLLPPSLNRPLSNYAKSVNLGPQKSYGGFFSMYEYYISPIAPEERSKSTLCNKNIFRLASRCSGTISAPPRGFWLEPVHNRSWSVSRLTPHAWSLAPAAVLLGWRLADTLLMVLGVTKNRYLDDNIPGKWAVHFLDSTTGEFSEEPADADVCVIILAARSNHPLGMFAPNYKTIFDFFNKNVADLEANAPENGFLGMSGWLQAGDRPTGSEAMMVGYFKDVSYLHKFAHGTSHRNGWNWWNSIVKDNPHLGIMHETYMVPKKHWESIYINYNRTGLAATNAAVPASAGKPGQTETKEDTIWVSPIVDSRKGVWKSSRGRMGREESDEIQGE